MQLGYLDLDEELLVEPEELDKYKKNKIVILTTGSQGETMSGLVRMAAGEHKKLSMIPGDLVIISSTPIPGNERYVSDVINMLYRKGANVINEGVAGRARFGPRLRGGAEADALADASQVLHPHPRGIPAPVPPRGAG